MVCNAAYLHGAIELFLSKAGGRFREVRVLLHYICPKQPRVAPQYHLFVRRRKEAEISKNFDAPLVGKTWEKSPIDCVRRCCRELRGRYSLRGFSCVLAACCLLVLKRVQGQPVLNAKPLPYIQDASLAQGLSADGARVPTSMGVHRFSKSVCSCSSEGAIATALFVDVHSHDKCSDGFSSINLY